MELLERRGAEACCLGDDWGLDCEILELDGDIRDEEELLELRELEKIEEDEDREEALCCLADGDDVERDTVGEERLI